MTFLPLELFIFLLSFLPPKLTVWIYNLFDPILNDQNLLCINLDLSLHIWHLPTQFGILDHMILLFSS